MIFVTVGTWVRGYDRLVEAVDKLISEEVIQEEVIAQIGNGQYQPENMKTMDFCSPGEIEKLMLNCRIVISHAGIGTIGQALRLRKPVIVLPRKVSRKEADDDHQLATAKYLEAEGKIIVAKETSDIADCLRKADTFVPSEGQGYKKMLEVVRGFIENLEMKKFGSKNKQETL